MAKPTKRPVRRVKAEGSNVVIRATYDAEADAVYVALAHSIGRVKGRPEEVIFDFDEYGEVVGIEILGAQKLSAKFLLQCKNITRRGPYKTSSLTSLRRRLWGIRRAP